MSNVTVQEALKSVDIEKLLREADLPLPSPYGSAYFNEYLARYEKFAESYHAALAELEKCDPVAKLGRWMIDKSTGTDILTLDNCSVIEGKYANYIMGLLQKEIDKVVSELENTTPQTREWVSLSDESVHELIAKYHPKAQKGVKKFEVTDWWRFANAIDAACRQLNTKG